MADDGHVVETCLSEGSLYERFREQVADPDRIQKAVIDKAEEFLAVEGVDVNRLLADTEATINAAVSGPFGNAIIRQVTASFAQVRRLCATIDVIRSLEADKLKTMLRSQDACLIESVAPPRRPLISEGKYVLVAFSVVEDQTITITQGELNRLIDEIVVFERRSDPQVDRDYVCTEAKRRADAEVNKHNGSLDDEVCDGIDILAHVVMLMRREGLKPVVRDPELQQFIVDFFDNAQGAASKTFGGAAGNETDVLRALGLPVLLYVPYHDNRQGDLAPHCTKRLVFGSGGPEYRPAKERSDHEEARRFSFVFQLTPELDDNENIVGPVFQVDNDIRKPSRADRVIFRFPNPRTEERAEWTKLKLIWRGEAHSEWESSNDDPKYDAVEGCWFVEVGRESLVDNDGKPLFGDNDWPYLPIFQHPPAVTGDTLLVELATVEEMEQVAEDVEVVLLGGIQAIAKERFLSQSVTALLQHVLPEQLKALTSGNADVHFELSGVDSGGVVKTLRRLLQASGVKNISLNREELGQIASEFGSDYFVFPRNPVPDTPIAICVRAVELLKNLGMDLIYIHDLELDILLCRNPEDEPQQARLDRLARHRQAMLLAKAAVPADLFRRAGASEPWDLVLSAESLAALAAFAQDYAVFVEPRSQERQAHIVGELTNTGFNFDPGLKYSDEESFSVVVAPAVFVTFPDTVSLSGAGDKGFAVRAAASKTP